MEFGENIGDTGIEAYSSIGIIEPPIGVNDDFSCGEEIDFGDGFGLPDMSGKAGWFLTNNGSIALWQEITTGGGIFLSDIDVVLSGGKSLGKYLNGETIPSAGLTFEEVMNDIAIEYITASFNSFSVSGQATTIEVGTTLSGIKTFTWSIDDGSGVVNTLDIYDYTTSSDIDSNTANDGSEDVTINSNQLNTESEIQQWRGVGTDVTPDPDVVFNSGLFTVTGLFYRFYGPTATSPTNSATVRALPSSEFQSGSDTFILNTGTTEVKFVVALPPGHTITEVVDLDALNVVITSEYVAQASINVLDAGGTNRLYNIYEMNIGVPYSTSHRHQITTT